METQILTDEQFNSPENQNRDNAIIGYRSIENGTKPLNIARVMPSCLRLSLKSKWFEMTKAGIKKEDYREITPYWLSRFILVDGEKYYEELDELCVELNKGNQSTSELFKWFGCEFRKFDLNTMTLGYPKNKDTERILKLEHKGIEIRTGNPEWGAEQNKLYFVIMHGAILA